MVQQEPFLFDGTITENIAYGKQDATFGEVVQAAVAAEAHEFIVGKPDGYDMKVGEKGGNLSGGEKQRISIARAILHDPRILILDEATSSLDTRRSGRSKRRSHGWSRAVRHSPSRTVSPRFAVRTGSSSWTTAVWRKWGPIWS